jgi:formylglycine-generating enzyme required for sulfatase activity
LIWIGKERIVFHLSRRIIFAHLVLIFLAGACKNPSPVVEQTKVQDPLQASPSAIAIPVPAIQTETRLREKDGALEIFIPAGEFLMGAASTDPLAYEDEFPQHSVYLDAYWIDQHEVTNAQYALCVEAGNCVEPGSYSSYTRDEYYDASRFGEYPVVFVDWTQAKDYCAWAGGRLPSEAEWEKAARGSDGRTYPWGEQAPIAGLLNYRNYVHDTSAVCSYPAGNSPYGLCDMAGSVWEWMNDRYDPTYYPISPAANPAGPSSGRARVWRGGSWFEGSGGVRASNRQWNYPDFQYSYIGFRCVREP